MKAEAKELWISDADLINAVDASLGTFVASRSLPSSLIEAIEYALFGGGKRVRPLLCLRACEVVGGGEDFGLEMALPGAAAIEFIHTFSLVHDDLPAMDDDDLRRGRPTLHKHASEAMAILAGDAMTALAFEIIAERIADSAIASRLTLELSTATNAMIAGQVYDTMGGHDVSLDPIEQLRQTHHNKTGALLRASVRMGAIMGHADGDQIESLSNYADAIGLMFQAVDDLLDVTQSAEKMGKATGKDAEQGKLTYPGLLGIEGTRAEIDKLLNQSLEALSGFDTKAEPLREMARTLAKREK
ncbi:MAG: polyprenyl synthetase family protein [Phycisphaeraceae bacterium]